jgi:hypothetical protein
MYSMIFRSPETMERSLEAIHGFLNVRLLLDGSRTQRKSMLKKDIRILPGCPSATCS